MDIPGDVVDFPLVEQRPGDVDQSVPHSRAVAWTMGGLRLSVDWQVFSYVGEHTLKTELPWPAFAMEVDNLEFRRFIGLWHAAFCSLNQFPHDSP